MTTYCHVRATILSLEAFKAKQAKTQQEPRTQEGSWAGLRFLANEAAGAWWQALSRDACKLQNERAVHKIRVQQNPAHRSPQLELARARRTKPARSHLPIEASPH